MFSPRAQNPALAAALICTACAFIAATMLIAKSLGSDQFGPALHPLQISNGRFVFALLCLSLAASVMRPKVTRPHMRWHVARTSAGWAGVTLMFASVAYIPLADATAITFLNPVFGMLLAIPLLGEQVGRVRWTAAAVALVGAMVLLRPTPESFQPAALLALGAAAIMGLELIFIKRLSGREGAFQILLINNALGVVISTLAVIAFWQPPTLAQWGLMGALGLLMACAQTCFVNAMARADASFVAPFSYLTLLFAALYDGIFYDVIPDGVTIVGACIIVAGALLLGLREAWLRRSGRPVTVSGTATTPLPAPDPD